jgi:hypothetical protein
MRRRIVGPLPPWRIGYLWTGVNTTRGRFMNGWVKLANFGSGLEADLTVARLHSAGLRAHARGNDIVGIVGPGFQYTTARGVDVLVPALELEEARAILGEDDPTE